VQHTVWEETSYSSTAGEPVAPLLDKTGGQTHGGNIFPLPGTECGTEKAHVGVGSLSSHCGESQVLPWRNQEQAETDSLTKGKAHF
jgi:hypothetical protein